MIIYCAGRAHPKRERQEVKFIRNRMRSFLAIKLYEAKDPMRNSTAIYRKRKGIHIYLSGHNYITTKHERELTTYGHNRCRSFVYLKKKSEEGKIMHYKRRKKRRRKNSAPFSLFIDSGAYSAHTIGEEIDLTEYIQFIKDNLDIVDVYSNLDVIGDAKATLKNQEFMESQGLQPIPAFHVHEDFNYLRKYIEKYDYVALGGMAQLRNGNLLAEWLDKCWDIICDEDGIPKVKIHGFAITRLDLILRYPWYSVDSSSWVVHSRTGSIYVPKKKDGAYNYLIMPNSYGVSNRSTTINNHYCRQYGKVKEHIDEYVHSLGLKMGKSEFKKVKEGYTLSKERMERFANKEKTKIEIIVEPGLSNTYLHRDKANVLYFNALERAIPEWPWPYKRKGKRSILL